MTQYQSPYQPPTGYAYAMSPGYDWLAPARKCSILLLCLGGLLLLGAGCFGIGGALLPQASMRGPEAAMLRDLENQVGMSASKLIIVLAIVFGVGAAIYITLGIAVRSGGMGIVITSMVLACLASLVLLLQVAGSLFQGSAGIPSACMCAAALGLHALLIVWLAQAIQSSMRFKQFQAQYQAQLQWQQYYGQGAAPQIQPPAQPGYGSHAPPQ